MIRGWRQPCIRLERPRSSRHRGPRSSEAPGPMARPEQVGQVAAVVVPGRQTDRVLGKPGWKHPAQDDLRGRQRRSRDLLPEGDREPCGLASQGTGAVLPPFHFHSAGPAHRPPRRDEPNRRRQPPSETAQGGTGRWKARPVSNVRRTSDPRLVVRPAQGPVARRGLGVTPRRPRIADRERMVHSTRIPRGAGLHGPRPELPRRDRLRPGVEAPQRPRPRRGGYGRHHRRRSVAREERLLCPGPTRGDRHVLRRIRGGPHPGESSRPLGGWGQRRRLLQLDDRDDERARLSAAVRPAEDGASGHGRGPVPQVFADLFLGQHPSPRPVHRRRARSPVPRHGGAGDGRGDAEDGEDRGLPRVPGRRPFAPQDVESDPAPRARDRMAHAVPPGRVIHQGEPSLYDIFATSLTFASASLLPHTEQYQKSPNRRAWRVFWHVGQYLRRNAVSPSHVYFAAPAKKVHGSAAATSSRRPKAEPTISRPAKPPSRTSQRLWPRLVFPAFPGIRSAASHHHMTKNQTTAETQYAQLRMFGMGAMTYQRSPTTRLDPAIK